MSSLFSWLRTAPPERPKPKYLVKVADGYKPGGGYSVVTYTGDGRHMLWIVDTHIRTIEEAQIIAKREADHLAARREDHLVIEVPR